MDSPTYVYTPTTVRRAHPDRRRWLEDESRLRASYLATRRALSPFLVPHRFEGNTAPDKLRRAGYGYGVQLNRSYLTEVIGHVRSTEATYEWGPLAEGENDATGAPAGGVARDIWTDATRNGVCLKEFIEGEVLEWLLSSVGGFILVDTSSEPGLITKADEKEAGVRPYFRFIPWGAVVDMGLSRTGFRFIKIEEEVDLRKPDGSGHIARHHIVYELVGDRTRVTRLDKEGNIVDANGAPSAPVDMGVLTDMNETPTLPLVPVKLGIHPELEFLGTGLLFGLEDIIIDLFNVTSEMREAYRDAAFGLMVHKGPDASKVRDALAGGSRFVTLGDTDAAALTREAGDSAEVATGITLIELGVRNWALSAKRQAAEAMNPAGGIAKESGVQVMAEFSLDLKPLLVRVVEALDAIETNALFIAAQLAGVSLEAADTVSVTRSTEFQLEDEASRIARLCRDFVLALPIAPEAKTQMAMAWYQASNIVDLSADAPDQPGKTVGDVIEAQTRELVTAEQAGKVAMASVGPAGAIGSGFAGRPPLRIAGGPPDKGAASDKGGGQNGAPAGTQKPGGASGAASGTGA